MLHLGERCLELVDTVSFDPDASGEEQSLSLEDLIRELIKIALRIEAHLKTITEEELTDDDVD